VPEIKQAPQKSAEPENPTQLLDNNQKKTHLSSSNSDDLLSASTSTILVDKSDSTAILETRRMVDLDNRLIRPYDSSKKLSQTSVNGVIKPPNIQLYSTTIGTLQSKNE